MKERFDRLLKVVAHSSSANASKLVGKDVDVLVENVGHSLEGGEASDGRTPETGEDAVTALTGRLGNNLLVHFEGRKSLVGEIVRVHIDECKDFYYLGSLCVLD